MGCCSLHLSALLRPPQRARSWFRKDCLEVPNRLASISKGSTRLVSRALLAALWRVTSKVAQAMAKAILCPSESTAVSIPSTIAPMACARLDSGPLPPFPPRTLEIVVSLERPVAQPFEFCRRRALTYSCFVVDHIRAAVVGHRLRRAVLRAYY